MKRLHTLLPFLAISVSLIILLAAVFTKPNSANAPDDTSLSADSDSVFYNSAVGDTKSSDTTAEIKESIGQAAESASAQSSAETAAVVPPQSFVEAQSRNPDVCAWVTIPNTAIDFPVLRNADNNEYYLRHDIDGNYNIDGSIFMENYNQPDFSDYMTVIYGHTMKWGTMFTPLLDYRDKTFFDNNRFIYIYTNDRNLTYKIFAAYVWDTRHLLLNVDFTSRIERSVYLQYIKSIRGINDTIADDITVTTDDRILTLSCCTMSGDGRFLVQGVLVDEQP